MICHLSCVGVLWVRFSQQLLTPFARRPSAINVNSSFPFTICTTFLSNEHSVLCLHSNARTHRISYDVIKTLYIIHALFIFLEILVLGRGVNGLVKQCHRVICINLRRKLFCIIKSTVQSVLPRGSQ